MFFLFLSCYNTDTYLVAWCNSIRQLNIDNLQIPKVRTNVQVFCSGVSSQFNRNEATSIGEDIAVDARGSNEKQGLYRVWEQHPIMRKLCCSLNDYVIENLNGVIKFEGTFKSYISKLKIGKAKHLRNRMSEICITHPSDFFCAMKTVVGLVDVAATLPDKTQWNSMHAQYKDAIRTRAVLLMKKFPMFQKLDLTLDDESVTNSIDYILDLVQANDIEKLIDYIVFLPENGAYHVGYCGDDLLCYYMKIVENVRLFTKSANPSRSKLRKIVNRGIDFKTRLQQIQLDTVVNSLFQQHETSKKIAHSLQKYLSDGFNGIKQYFKKVAEFDGEIAAADIAYIRGALDSFKEVLSDSQPEVAETVNSILQAASGVTAVDVVKAGIVLVTDIAESCNPFKFLLGGGGGDVAESAQELSKAIAKVAKSDRLLAAFDTMSKRSIEISRKISENDKVLKAVQNLVYGKYETIDEFEKIKNSFLTEYNDYSPKVTRPEIEEMSEYWITVVSIGCDLIDDSNTIVGDIRAAFKNGGCIDAPRQIQKMISVFTEIYDFQFDLMDSMAAYIRAEVVKNSAEEIQSDFDTIKDSDKTFEILERIGALTYIEYRAHVQDVVELYCNVLEYEKGGKRPSACKGLDTHLSTLISVKTINCWGTREFFDAPSQPSSTGDLSFINVTKLFLGEVLDFKISSSEWLVEHGWIHAHETNYAFYVEQFEVYIPSENKQPVRYKIEAKAISNSKLNPNSDTVYILVPQSNLVYQYNEGPNIRCHKPTFKNVYTNCQTHSNIICPISNPPNNDLNPSIYSHWRIKFTSSPQTSPPKAATPLSVKIGLNLCKLNNGNLMATSLVKRQAPSSCCESNTYKNNQGMCVNCPAGSTSTLAGYYCKKNQ